MTTHYTIKIKSTSTEFKATYRDGKFKKLEHLRGTLNQTMLNFLGKIIPQQENQMKAFEVDYNTKVTYSSEEKKAVSIYSKFNTAWFSFYQKENNNRKPKFTAADGKSLKGIIAYLLDEHNNDENAAFAVWFFILDNWKHLPTFYRSNQDLKIINSKLNIIISELENKHTSNERTFTTAAGSESARAFKFGKNH